MTDGDEQEDGANGGGGGFSLSLRDVRRIITRHIQLVLACSAAAVVVGVSIAFALPSKFEAAATIQIDPRNKKIVNIEGVLSDIKTDTPALESEVEVIKSRSIALRVIEDLKLRDDPEFNEPSLIDTILVRFGLASLVRPAKSAPASTPNAAAPDATPAERSQTLWSLALGQPIGISEPSRDDVAIAFASRLKVQRVRNTLLLELKFTSTQSVKAARIANAIAEAYVRAQIDVKSRATELAAGMLDERLSGLREKVAKAERKIEQFKASNDMFDADGQPLDGKELQREMEALIAARNNTADRRAKYEQARRMMLEGQSQDTLAEVLQNSSIRLLREEYVKAMRREAELETKYGPKHPEMQKIVADVAKAQLELSTEIGKIIRSLKSDLEVAAEKEHQQEARLEELKAKITGSREQQWRLRELEREATATKQLYQSILERNKQTEETVDLQLPDARVVARADIPVAPSSPKRKLIVIGAGVAGLGLGVALAFLLELAGIGISRPEEVERRLRTSHLASLPLEPLLKGRPGTPMALVRRMIGAPVSPFSESIRALRLELDSRSVLDAPRVILVTSSQAGEGKTTVAGNLALAYAVTRHRTLLIDGDMRQHGLSTALGVDRRQGLAELLAKGGNIDAAILKDKSTGLHVLPASDGGSRGKARNEPTADLLSERKLERLFRTLLDHYEIVVVDSPPLLPLVDGRLIAEAADQIVLVAKWRVTQAAMMLRALRALGGAGRKLCGVVFNQVDPEIHGDIVGSYPPDRGQAPPQARNVQAA